MKIMIVMKNQAFLKGLTLTVTAKNKFSYQKRVIPEMELNPLDFFPGYDPYYAPRRPRSYSTCISICTHFLAMVFAVGICGGAFYYYDNYMKDEFEGLFSHKKIKLPTPQNDNNKITEILKDMDRIKGEIEQTNIWRKHLDEIFTKIYVKQDEVIEDKIEKALDLYDADKVGLFDYASSYACGSIVSILDTIPYPANRSISFFNLVNVDLMSNPDNLLQPNNLPGNCFAFYGDQGRIRIKLGDRIIIRAVTLDHIKLIEDLSSAPKEFEVFGLYDKEDTHGVSLGKFVYDIKGRPCQTFRIHDNHTSDPFKYVELNILSNHGKEDFTCVYRFRVHSAYPT